MTAVVGILNMTAVAIAADSAVTVTNQSNEKIFNNANKIFQLSKYNPVGLAIYGSGSLMFTPWEVVIKTYRNHLGSNSFGTVTEYCADFLSFLDKNNYFSTPLGFESKIASTVKSVLDALIQIVQNLVINADPSAFFSLNPSEQTDAFKNKLKEQLSITISNLSTLPPNAGDFSGVKENDLLATVTNLSLYNNHSIFQMGWVDQDTLKLLNEYFYKYFVSSDFSQSVPTGLVFVGYGEEQLYPQCHCVEIAEVIQGKLRWNVHSDTSISDSMQSAIMPFAQGDVIQTIISGLSPDLDQELLRQLQNAFISHNQQVANIIQSSNPNLAQQLRNGFNINNILNQLGQNIAAYQNAYSTTKTLDSVRLFSREDLAELAESLIYLTYLKRRMTFAQETVSKPVDVAVISKGEGFIWIKRKFYFDVNLNPHFLRNHFRETL